MNDVVTLLGALGPFISGLGATFVLVWNSIRTSRRERRSTTDEVLRRLREAAADGELTAAEIAEALDPPDDDEEGDRDR